MSLKLYADLVSQPCRSLYILLKKNNVPFETVLVQIGKGEHLTEEFEKNVWRFKKLPVIDDNGFKLAESIAILRYLARTKSIDKQWYPEDPKLQARVDEYLEWQHLNTRLQCSLYFQKKWLFPTLFKKVTPPEKLKPFEDNMIDCLDKMETMWLDKSPYIVGDKITAADIWAATEIEQPRIAGFEPAEGRPKLAAWLGRVREATNPYYDEAHKMVNILVKKTKEKLQSKA